MHQRIAQEVLFCCSFCNIIRFWLRNKIVASYVGTYLRLSHLLWLYVCAFSFLVRNYPQPLNIDPVNRVPRLIIFDQIEFNTDNNLWFWRFQQGQVCFVDIESESISDEEIEVLQNQDFRPAKFGPVQFRLNAHLVPTSLWDDVNKYLQY